LCRSHFSQSKAKVKKRTGAESLPKKHKGQSKYKSGNKKRRVETDDAEDEDEDEDEDKDDDKDEDDSAKLTKSPKKDDDDPKDGGNQGMSSTAQEVC
jgi:hypothetical protein